MLAAGFLLTYAITVEDPVFVALQSYQLFATIVICFFSKKYRHNLCEIHDGIGGR